MMTTTLFVVLKSKKKLQGKFKILIGYACVSGSYCAVIEGPVGLTHRSHNVSSFEALITGFIFLKTFILR